MERERRMFYSNLAQQRSVQWLGTTCFFRSEVKSSFPKAFLPVYKMEGINFRQLNNNSDLDDWVTHNLMFENTTLGLLRYLKKKKYLRANKLSSLAYFSNVVISCLKSDGEIALPQPAELPWSPRDKNCLRFPSEEHRHFEAVFIQPRLSDLQYCNSSRQPLWFQFKLH